MHRTIFTVMALVGLVGFLAVRANAEDRVFIYHSQPVRTVIYEPAPPVLAYDPDERFAAAYTVQGIVTWSVPYHMSVRIHDSVYPVALHDGTIIKPTGVTLEPSMVVNVAGYWSGRTFIANRIVVLRY